MKDNIPKYVLIGFKQADKRENVLGAGLKKRNQHVYEKLAKNAHDDVFQQEYLYADED